MYINTKTNAWPVSEADIRAAHPNVAFPHPFVPPEEYAYVFPAPAVYDPETQTVRPASPELTKKGTWEERWEPVPIPEEVIAAASRSSVRAKIAALEAQQTERLVREAVLGGDYAIEKLAQIEAEISALREQL